MERYVLGVPFAVCVSLTNQHSAAAAAPNIVLIVADDLGGTIGGQGVATPNISVLAAGGVTFSTAYASPLCVPSRAKILTGRQEHELGVYVNPTGPEIETFGLPVGTPTIADVLRGQGYATGIFGKWHLGVQEQFRPLNRGFQEGYYVLRSDAPLCRRTTPRTRSSTTAPRWRKRGRPVSPSRPRRRPSSTGTRPTGSSPMSPSRPCTPPMPARPTSWRGSRRAYRRSGERSPAS